MCFFLSCEADENTSLNLDTVGADETTELHHKGQYKVICDPVEKPYLRLMELWTDRCIDTIEGFFHKGFNHGFTVKVYSSRDRFEAGSPCWFVGWSTENRVHLLSPLIWEDQSCEPAAGDPFASFRIVLHEVVHVFHLQYRDAAALDSTMRWFSEGLAEYVSGRTDLDSLEISEQIKAEKYPTDFKTLYDQKNFYTWSGLLVGFIDHKYGRDMLHKILEMDNSDQFLELLETRETDLFSQWNRVLKAQNELSQH